MCHNNIISLLQGLSHHLLHACSHGLSNAVQLVITTDPELDLDAPLSCGDTNEQGLTPLAVATFSNAPLVCELLIKAGAGVNSTDALQRSPLHWAVLRNNLSTVRVLLKHGASAELADQKVCTFHTTYTITNYFTLLSHMCIHVHCTPDVILGIYSIDVCLHTQGT